MIDESQNNKRIAKNTVVLYVRMLLTMGVTLYTSRVVLGILGIDDYGIYNVVGGVVAMFVFLNAAMTTSTQRYLTFYLAKKNEEKLRKVFVVSINIHVIISMVIVVLAETVGLYFLLCEMQIPDGRECAAMWVYQLSIITTIIAVMSYPYNAVIVAHEKMSVFAYISILEAVLKLAIIFLLYILGGDKLIVYAVLIVFVQLSIRVVYSVYCKRHFAEANYKFFYDKRLTKEMLSFASWNLWGNAAAALFGQGLNLLLNVFFGPSVNAARGISIQVQGAVHQCVTSFQTAINPQITKTYANKDLIQMHSLVFSSARLTFILLLALCFPIMLETQFVLEIWLKNVPEYSVIFVRIMLLTMIIDSTSNPLMVSAVATGNVKKYQSVVGGILLAIVPISYIVLKLGGAPWSVFVVHLCICCIAYIVRLLIIRPMIQLKIKSFFYDVVLRSIKVGIVSLVVPLVLKCIFQPSNVASVIIMVASFISVILSAIIVGLNGVERHVLMSKIKDMISKFH